MADSSRPRSDDATASVATMPRDLVIDLRRSPTDPVIAARPAEIPAPARVVHRPEVVERGSFAIARCAACGWSGSARRARAVADADAAAHR